MADSAMYGGRLARDLEGVCPDTAAPVDSPLGPKPDVPGLVIEKWQREVDLVAGLAGVPAGLVVRVVPPPLTVLAASSGAANPIARGQALPAGIGPCCEAMMRQRRPVMVPDARRDPAWPGCRLGGAEVLCFVGCPVDWPGGEIFGAVCFLDVKANDIPANLMALIVEFGEIVRADLKSLVETETFKRAEEERGKSERLLRAIADSAEDCIFTKDTARRYTFVNPAMERLLGLPASELLGKTPEEVFDPQSALKIAKVDAPVLQGQRVDKVRTLDVAGVSRSLHTIQVPLTGPDGHVEGMCGIVRDITERTQTDHERRRLYLFRSYFLQSVMGMGLASFQQEWTEVNARLCQMLGYRRNKLVGMRWADLTHPEDLHIDDSQFASLLDGSIEEYEVVKRLIRKDGQTIHVEFSVRCYRHSTVMPDHLVVLIQDITERKLVAEALARSEEKYRQLVENANSIIMRMDVQGNVTFFNEYAQQFFGFEEREIIGRNVVGTIVPEVESTGRELAELVADIGVHPAKYITNENENMRRNGERVWIAWTNRPIRGENGEVVELLCVGNDITARRRVEEALHERSEALEQSLDGIALAAPNGIITYVNRAWAAMHGYEPAEVIGQHLSIFHTPEQMAGEVEPFNQIVLSRGGNNGQVGHVTRDGRVFQTRMSATVYRDHRGAPKGLIGIARDISEELRLERQLRHAQRMEAIGVLAGGIAHNLRNTLGSTLGWLEMAADRADGDAAIGTCLQRATNAARRGAEQVRQVLRFARQAEPERRPLAILPIVREASELLRQAMSSTIALVQDFDEGCGLVLADADEIEQVVLNLGTNALQAMEGRDGVLEISLREVEIAPTPTASSEDLEAGRYAQLVVRDTGIGIDRDVLDRIFEPFFTTKEPNEGTGLGLSTVHGIVAAHDGAISVASEAGKGSSFTVMLPIWDGEAAAPEAAPPSVPGAAGAVRKRVLVIDDDQDFAEMATMGLAGLSFEVETQTTAVQGLDRFVANRDDFDIVILDQVMPGMTGLDLARKIRQVRPDIPLVLLSGLAERVDTEEAAEAGINTFVTKPATPRELGQVICKMLGLGAADEA